MHKCLSLSMHFEQNSGSKVVYIFFIVNYFRLILYTLLYLKFTILAIRQKTNNYTNSFVRLVLLLYSMLTQIKLHPSKLDRVTLKRGTILSLLLTFLKELLREYRRRESIATLIHLPIKQTKHK